MGKSILAKLMIALRPGADGPVTKVEDVIVPEIFNPYVQQQTEEKSNLIRSGALVRDEALDAKLAGGGLTFNMPSFRDLDNDEDNVSGDEADDSFTGGSDNSTPKKIRSAKELGVRLSRNQSWGSSDLASKLAAADPMSAIGGLVGGYWSRRLQAAFVATMKGVFADNALDPTGTDLHEKDDMTNDISGSAFVAGTTNFGGEAFIDAAVTMGDSMGDLTMVMVHSIVFARMQKNNLIDFIPDAEGKVSIPTFLGRIVVVDDGVPFTAGVFETWLFGSNAVRLGVGSAEVPTETERKPGSGNGGGSEILYNRQEFCIHPTGYRYNGTAANGGPANGATANNLANAGSWSRVYGERKQIKIARLITREF